MISLASRAVLQILWSPVHNVCLSQSHSFPFRNQMNTFLFHNTCDLHPAPFCSLKLYVIMILYLLTSVTPTFPLALVIVLLYNVSELLNDSTSEK